MRTLLLVLSAALVLACPGDTQPPQKNPLKFVQTISMQDVEGRIDHLAVDVRNHRLFVAALGNNTLEVIDLQAGKRVHTIRGLREPQGVAYMANLQRLCVANGQGEGVDIFDGTTYGKIGTVKLGEDTDNLRINPESGDIVAGYGRGALAFIQAREKGGEVVRRISLFGHPEAFQIDPQGKFIYVNVPSEKAVRVCKADQDKPVAMWPLTDASANFPMALDAAHHLLYVGCREPAMLSTFDTEEGKLKVSTPIVGDTDDVFYDSALDRIYVIGGGGAVDVFEHSARFQHRKLATVPTAPGARTGLFVPALHRLYVAVPHRGNQRAEIRVYETQS